MEENVNNNEVNNNYNQLPNNNYYEPKNNNGVKVLLVILILLVLVAIGLLSYKMFVLDKKDDNKDASNKVEEKKLNIDEMVIKTDLNSIPSSNDGTFVKVGIVRSLLSKEELMKNFTNLEKEFNGKKVLFNCKNFAEVPYGDDFIEVCDQAKVVYNNALQFETLTWRTGLSYYDVLYENDNYYVVVSTGGVMTAANITIYDKSGKLVKTIDEILANSDDFDDKGYLINEFKYIKFVNNKIYYVEDVQALNENTNEKINYEIKTSNDGWKELYIDGSKIKLGYYESIEVKQYKDMLLVKWSAPGAELGVSAVYKDGKVTELNYKFNPNEGIDNAGDYRIDGNKIYVKHGIGYSNAFRDFECRIEDTSLLSSYEVKYEYLGNGKFSTGEVVNKKTIKDNYANKCKDVTVFKDIRTEKLCSRNNDKVTCYSITGYENIKNKLFELYGEDNCKNKEYVNGTVLRCQLSDSTKYCELSTSGDLVCDYEI